jgi:peptidoglycan/LPS O-acetylase OafA/YrhL
MIGNERLPSFRPDIEGLRGIAILIVVLFHCGLPGISGGFVGVDVFFVLSGYLITGIMVNEIQNTTRLSLLQFYARRARRLLPASSLTLVATLIVGALILAPHEVDLLGHASRAASMYVSNIFFDHNESNYFATSVKSNPLLHTWSLAVEEQFYLFWPLLVSLTMVWLKSMRALIGVLFGLTILSLGTSIWSTTTGGTFAFYELPARTWEFSLGGLAVLLPRGVLTIHSSWWSAVGWLGILAIVGSSHLIGGEIGFPGWVAIIPVMGTVMALIAGSEHPKHGFGVILSSPLFQMLGRLSYSWYLWHWPILVFSAALLPSISIAGKITAAAAALVVAAVSYHLVEFPIRFHPALLMRPALTLCLAGVLTLCSVSAAFFVMGFADQLSNEPQMQAVTTAIKDVTRLPIDQCVTSLRSSEVKVCHFGDKSSNVSIILFGDSHAVQWFNPLERIAELNGWKLLTVVKSSCAAFDFRQPSVNPGIVASCARWRAKALQRIVGLHPTIVFIGNLTSSLGVDSTIRFSLDDLRDGVRRTLQALTDTKVVLMRDTPYFSYDIPTCLGRFLRRSWYPGGSCEADRSNVLNAAVFESEQAGARGFSNVHYIDLTDHICQIDICRPVQDQTPIYRDHHHLTGSFADSLIPALEIKLFAILSASVNLAAVR